MKVFEKGEVPDGYEPLQKPDLSNDAHLKGCRSSNKAVWVTSEPTYSMAYLLSDGGEIEVGSPSKEEAIRWLTIGAEFVGADGLELIMLKQGKDLSCPEPNIHCREHQETAKVPFICKKQYIDKNEGLSWYGVAKLYKLK